ncbi:MAG: hypothetical protein LBN26_02550 [Christensenellaceae bacterium]|jgi:multimeric flavodoxin WrbA|nr:hypothetical protein [Christensenellaceae bacterium]
MKIAFINGSPKPAESASEIIINALQARVGQGADSITCNAIKQSRAEIMESLAGSPALVLVFPLYVDGIPSHLLRLLDGIQADIAGAAAPGAKLYAVVNNGFYEGRQNGIALEMLQNFCARAGLAWAGGLGVGSGGMVFAAPIGHGPMKNLGKALDALAANIRGGTAAGTCSVEPNFPKFLYTAAVHLGWRLQAKRNGLKPRDIKTSR